MDDSTKKVTGLDGVKYLDRCLRVEMQGAAVCVKRQGRGVDARMVFFWEVFERLVGAETGGVLLDEAGLQRKTRIGDDCRDVH